MKSIHSQADFETALQAENSIIFIHFPSSEQSRRAQQAVEQWEHELATSSAHPNLIIHLLAPDAHPYTWKWATKHTALSDDSNTTDGTLIWLRRGVVVGGLPNVAQAGIKALSRMTDECFLHGKQPGMSAPSTETPAFDIELLNILCCPETHQQLQMAAPPILEKLNQQIAAGRLHNRIDRVQDEKLSGGLIRADGKFLYPIRHNIPILLVDEAIPLKGWNILGLVG